MNVYMQTTNEVDAIKCYSTNRTLSGILSSYTHPNGWFWINLGSVANPRPVAKIKTGRVSQPITDAARPVLDCNATLNASSFLTTHSIQSSSMTFNSLFVIQSNSNWQSSQLDSLRWFSQRRSATPHFWSTHPGGYDPHIRTRPRLLYSAPTTQVSSSYVSSFGSYRVDKQTNTQTHKQTDAVENTQRSSLRYDVGQSSALNLFVLHC